MSAKWYLESVCNGLYAITKITVTMMSGQIMFSILYKNRKMKDL